MLEIAGFVVSGISLINDLYSRHKDLTSWEERDLEVDRKWLPLAIQKGQLPGNEADYAWSRVGSVPTRKLKGTHTVVIAHNDEKKIKYRIVWGSGDDRSVLMRKTI